MRLDPDSVRVLRLLEEWNDELGWSHDLSDRERLHIIEQVFLRERSLVGPSEPVGTVEERSAPSRDGSIPVRIYTPIDPPNGVLVYAHGGGWVSGSVNAFDPFCRRLTNAARFMVVSVDYRLAPACKYPAAVTDVWAVCDWASAHLAGQLPLVVAGDSAGGNIAAGVALMARDRSRPCFSAQVLIYPALDPSCSTASYVDSIEDRGLARSDMLWLWGQYLQRPEDRHEPYAAPVAATDAKGLPPTLIVTAEFDPLRDEAETFGMRLRDNGVPAVIVRHQGMIHGFLYYGVMEAALPATRALGAALRQLCGVPALWNGS